MTLHSAATLPERFDTLFRRAAALAEAGDWTGAQTAYRRALALDPENIAALNNLGGVLLARGDAAAAVECFQAAIRLAPECAKSRFNLAAAQRQRGDLTAARDQLTQVVQLEPAWPAAHNALGDVLAAGGDAGTAAASYRRALASRPDCLLWKLRHDTTAGPVFGGADEIDRFRAGLEVRLRRYQKLPTSFDLADIDETRWRPPMSLAYQGRNDRTIKSLYAGLLESRIASAAPPVCRGTPHVGFVVTGGHEGVFLRGMAGVVDRLAGRRLRITIVCSPGGRNRIKARLRHPAVDYLLLPERIEKAAAAVRGAALDLLYYWEIGSDATNYFLPMFRPAAVQCTSWGWPVTSGMAAIDYFVTSDLIEPPDADAHYTERLVRLAGLPNYYERPPRPAGLAPRRHFGLGPTDHVYFCGQNPRKIHPDFDLLIGEILRREPRGVFVLIESRPRWITTALIERLRRRLGTAADRVHVCPRMTPTEYHSLLACADVVLDTLHYGGGANTTYDALAAGAPVVTLPGQFHRGRYTLACYRKMGILDAVAASAGDYVETALRLAGDRHALRHLGDQIRDGSGVLFDDAAAVRELEQFFIDAIQRTRGEGSVRPAREPRLDTVPLV